MLHPSSARASCTERRGRARRNRSGIVGFLEFAGTLPVFAMLFLSCMALHLYYKETRQAYSEAQDAVWIMMDQHMSGRLPPKLAITARVPNILDQLTAGVEPQVKHLTVYFFQAVSTRKTGTLSWLGPGLAVGFSYGNRDSWAHFDMENQLNMLKPAGMDFANGVESMPYVLLSPTTNGVNLVAQFFRI